MPVENLKFSKIVNDYVFDFIKLYEELLFRWLHITPTTCKTSNKLLCKWKWPCIKDFIIIFMLFIFGLCLLCFLKKKKKCPGFWKKNRVSSLRNFSHWNLSSVCLLQIRCLSKCSYLKKHPQGLLPWKIPGYAPDVNQRSINPATV